MTDMSVGKQSRRSAAPPEVEVFTAFHDIGELAAGLRDRIGSDQLILYGPSAPQEGAQISFSIAFENGTTALQGGGWVAAAVDGGEEREPEARYDIFLERLQLDAVAQRIFGQMLAALQDGESDRQSLVSAEDSPLTASSASAGSTPAVANDPWSESSVDEILEVETVEEDKTSLSIGARRSSMPPKVPSSRPSDGAKSSDLALAKQEAPRTSTVPADEEERLRRLRPTEYLEPQIITPSWEAIVPQVEKSARLTLSRASRHVDWSMPEAPTREPRPSSGAFAYSSSGLPNPSRPPRPDSPADRRLMQTAQTSPQASLRVDFDDEATASGDPTPHEFEEEVQLQTLNSDLVDDEAGP